MANSAMSSHGGATELIPLTADTDGIQAVMGRDLHRFLEAPTRYNDWIGRLIEKYGFIAGQDFYSKMSKTTGGRPSEDHILTMDMAKEISMVQNNEKGKQARRYFIECERKAKIQHPAIPQTYAEALEAAATQARRAEELEAQQALNAPKVEYHDQFVADTDLIQFRTLANQINIGEQHLRQLLQNTDGSTTPQANDGLTRNNKKSLNTAGAAKQTRSATSTSSPTTPHHGSTVK